MLIHLQNVKPDYLDPSVIDESEIWGNEIRVTAPEGIVLWGPSGRGKSTFLRILYGLENRYTGNLHLDGKPYSDLNHRSWPRIRSNFLAFVSQDFRLFPENTGWENLKYLPQWAPGVDPSTLENWSDRLGIAPLLQRPPSTWSQGQQQRFCLLRALASPFSLILLDEPVSHLDPASAEASLTLLLEVCSERKAGWVLSQQTAQTDLPAQRILQI